MSADFEKKDYYLGLDCGTSSVGFAVTDTDYNLLKFNGKSMWGSHLFEEAKTAQERRVARCLRRRRDRQRQRIDLLQELFAEEINKIDPTFFIRLNDSNYLVEDKDERIRDRNILFNDRTYKDKDHFKSFPTAYHLRMSLIENGTMDPRILYLGIHHILKHRGHFLFPGENMSAVANVGPLVDQLKDSFNNVYESELYVSSSSELEKALQVKGNSKKQEEIGAVISCIDSKLKGYISKILVGYKVKTDLLFGKDEYKDLCAIEFKKATFEDSDLPVLEGALTEDEFELIRILKALFDWALFANVMSGNRYISQAKVALFDQNGRDLRLLKKLVKKYCDVAQYEQFFHSDEKGMFSSYVGKNHDSRKGKEKTVRKASTDDFYKELKKLLDKMDQSDPEVFYIKSAVENDAFLPLLSSFRNGVIPYQVNMIELDAILKKACQLYSNLHGRCEAAV